MPHAYSEDQLFEQSAIGLFSEFGWTTVSAFQNLRRTRDPAAARLPRLVSGQAALASAAQAKQNVESKR